MNAAAIAHGDSGLSASGWFDRGGRDYARHRPDYPAALAAFLAGIAPDHGLAVDVGCGTGQFTRQLADHLERVMGIDPSADQLAHATPHPRIRYRQGSATRLDLPNRSAALVTAAQAAHWFDLPAFHAEVHRIALPGAIVALVSYGVPQLEPALRDRFLTFYRDEIGPFWPPERRLVDQGYAGIDFPYVERPFPALAIERRWSAQDFLGYVATWSAVRRARDAGRADLVEAFAADLIDGWGDGDRTVTWPIAMRLGEVTA